MLSLSLGLGLGSNVVASGGAAAVPLFDNFNSGTINAAKWTTGSFAPGNATNASVTVTDNGANAVIQPISGAAGYNGLITTNTASFVGKQIIVELVTGMAGNSSIERWFGIGADLNNGYRIIFSGGSMIFRGYNAGAFTNLITAITDPDYGSSSAPTTYHWLRIWHDSVADFMNFDIANSSAPVPPTSWTNLCSVARSDSFWNKGTTPAIRAGLSGGQFGTLASPPSIGYDNLYTDAAF